MAINPMSRVEVEIPKRKTRNVAQRTLMNLNTYRTGFTSGILMTALLATGAAHLVFNVYRAGFVTIGGHSFGQARSAEITEASSAKRDRATSTTMTDMDSSVQAQQESASSAKSDGSNRLSNAESGQTNKADTVSPDTRLILSYDSNRELPGFNPDQGYQQAPAAIGDFSKAMPLTAVGLGQRNANFDPRSVFIDKRKYQSALLLKPNQFDVTRVGFDLLPSSRAQEKAEGLFLQFGLGDLDVGSTTLTYEVSVFGDGALLWSNLVRYADSQLASVVLDVENYSDIVIEYQVIEAGDVSVEQNPLYFTEAKLLFS